MYFDTAIERITHRNPNPYNSEAYYNKGLACYYMEQYDDAFDAFYKATWSSEQQEMSYYYLACIASLRTEYDDALLYIERSIIKNSRNLKARGLKSYILSNLGQYMESITYSKETLNIDPFEYVTRYELIKSYKKIGMTSDAENETELTIRLMRDYGYNFLLAARNYSEYGAHIEIVALLQLYKGQDPLVHYYVGYSYGKLNDETSALESIHLAENSTMPCCFPNKVEDIRVLEYALPRAILGKSHYYLGNLYYDKLQWEKATKLWEESIELNPTFAIPYRNLALSYYNKYKEYEKAKTMLEKAYCLEPSDPRLFLELDQLYKKLGKSYVERLERYEEALHIISLRDDLYIEYVTLLNATGQYEKSYQLIMNRKFHPWEGGEGKITGAYTMSLLQMGKLSIRNNRYKDAVEYLLKALAYPENLGEGKLTGTTDNNIHYYLGVAYEGQKDEERAMIHYKLATVGNHVPTSAMYYNDQPADMILFQGLAHHRLGNTKSERECFNRLLDYGEKHIYDEITMDYFAVSLPDFLIFEEDLTKKNKAHCHYLMGLAYNGMCELDKAITHYELSLTYDSNHMLSYTYLKDIK